MYENRTVEEVCRGVFGRFADRLIGSGSGGATAPLWGK